MYLYVCMQYGIKHLDVLLINVLRFIKKMKDRKDEGYFKSHQVNDRAPGTHFLCILGKI